MATIANISRPLEKSAMTAAWIHGGALRAPPCIEGEVMGDFARGREIFAIIAMRIASIRIGSTQYQRTSIPEI